LVLKTYNLKKNFY